MRGNTEQFSSLFELSLFLYEMTRRAPEWLVEVLARFKVAKDQHLNLRGSHLLEVGGQERVRTGVVAVVNRTADAIVKMICSMPRKHELLSKSSNSSLRSRVGPKAQQ